MENIEEDPHKKNHSDFSIEHILHRAGLNNNKKPAGTEENVGNSFSWLKCTRFCPPKVPRLQKKESTQKRQLGRYPRIPFTCHQIALLEEKFQESPYLSSEEATDLSKKLQLADVKVKIWFQNRRARKRREEMGIMKNQTCTSNVRNNAGTSSSSTGETSTSDLVQDVPISMPFIYITQQNIVDFSKR